MTFPGNCARLNISDISDIAGKELYNMKTAQDLKNLLQSIDHKSYPAYKSAQGSYRFRNYVLSIDHVQGDPFASPSRVSLLVSGSTAGFPENLYDTAPKRIALQDRLLRLFGREIEQYNFKAKGSGKSGLMSVSRCGQEILERSACALNPRDGSLILRMQIGFPASGRTIQSGELIRILYEFLPGCAERSLFYKNLDADGCRRTAELCEDQEYIRSELKKRALSAFVANGSILPRSSGISEKPMREAVPFRSPESLEISMNLPHRGTIRGMGIPRGITLVVGGGFHGKSTLLKALERGVYNHIAGDGREYVITDDSAVKLRAEDARSISQVDISLFINHLPGGRNTRNFSTEDASGSTSQAANVVEAMEAGTTLFLIDEDTSATNFMIRDELMQRVVADQEEPITPFISRVRELFEQAGISSILVAGSSGSYFHSADVVIQMKEYLPYDITEKAKNEASRYPEVLTAATAFQMPSFHRVPRPGSALREQERTKIKVLGREGIQINRSSTDLRYLEQLADTEQLAALAYILNYSARHLMDGRRTLQEIVDFLENKIYREGLASLSDSSYLASDLCRPRRQEIFACLDRCRELTFTLS